MDNKEYFCNSTKTPPEIYKALQTFGGGSREFIEWCRTTATADIIQAAYDALYFQHDIYRKVAKEELERKLRIEAEAAALLIHREAQENEDRRNREIVAVSEKANQVFETSNRVFEKANRIQITGIVMSAVFGVASVILGCLDYHLQSQVTALELRVTELVHNVDKVNALVSPTSDAKLKEEPSDTKVAMPTPQIPAKITPIPSSP